MTYPRISVVTPSYNQGPLIEETLRSIHDPGYPNLEHIVIDGGSTDQSVEIIERYADKLAFWVSEPDGGQTHALRKGFEKATGDILCWLNSDDLYRPNTLFEVARTMEEKPEARFLYGDSMWVTLDGDVIRPKKEHGWNRFIWMYDHNFFPQPSTFWRRDLYEQVGGLDESFDLAMDGDLFIRFADVTKPIHVRSVWSHMRYYPEQKNVRLREQSNLEDVRIRARYLRDEPAVVRRAKRLTAKSMRVAWKLATGCYRSTS